MQYTASSFVEPITRMFSFLRLSRREFAPPVGPLPSESAFVTQTPDIFEESLWIPLFNAVSDILSRIRMLQQGRIHLYVLYVVLALLALLLWKLR
jgi:hydrogenase-4 component B